MVLDLLGEGGLLTDDVLMSALGDDVNFDLIDDINSQHGAIDQRYDSVPSDGTRNHEHGFVTDSEILSTVDQFQIDATGALTSSSSDPKLFNPSSPEAPKTGFLRTVQKEQNTNVVSSLPIQLSPQQLAALQQQNRLQVGHERY